MSFEFLNPVEDVVVAHSALLPNQSLGQRIAIHSKQNGIPELKGVHIAIIGVEEGRRAEDNYGAGNNFGVIRKYLYQLFPGNWFSKIVDLGNIPQGETEEDSYFALQEIIVYLVKHNIIPIIIGGGQDLTYANYRAYDKLEQTVNLTTVDTKFDLGTIEEEISSTSFLSKVIMEQPSNLFNYSNIGYQTYFNSQEEIDLLEKLYFDTYRLGEITNDIKIVEPVFRDTDVVSIDIGSVRRAEAPANNNAVPNGFYGETICAISRYAGISDKVSSFGIYEYNAKLDEKDQTAHLIAQMIWYFIEGFNFRTNEYPFTSKKDYTKYIVPIEDTTINFFKSNKSDRWWMEVEHPNNKTTKHTLIPCTYQDYLRAGNQVIPERWWKTFRKLN
ncbi:formimidoylglutamase [Aureibaculum luteum]|uniref:formimidoylglutamase n=1 Tax=Aureibaculum luteum TaxID=1548456 RepID=UPI000E4EF1B4|nr:formimidoylglutamase [Aureibaculum luteum]